MPATTTDRGPLFIGNLLYAYLQRQYFVLQTHSFSGIFRGPSTHCAPPGHLCLGFLVRRLAFKGGRRAANYVARFLAPRGEGENVSAELSELGAFGVYHSRSLPWAKAATREAMAAVMEAPSLAAAQALVSLTLYWFGTGDSKSADLCLGTP
jgi:hypothetical protein